MRHADVIMFGLQLAALVSVALLFGHIARRLKQPVVLGELIGGVILGPTILGGFAPQLYSGIFTVSPSAIVARDTVANFGLFAFLFVAGMEMDFSDFRSQTRGIAGITILGMIVPFVLGFASVHCFPGFWALHVNQDFNNFALFLATALSISALPVIARILLELNLLKTKFGTSVMTSAALDDLIGWGLFAFVLQNYLHDMAKAGSLKIPMILCMFIIGIIVAPFIRSIRDFIYKVVMGFFAPIYFVSIGLKTNFFINFDWALVLVIFVIACLGKIIGATLGASFGKMPFKESLAVGFAMNARGAMEIVLATVALEYQLIDERIFVALFIMALGTSMLSGPMIKWLLIKPHSVLN